MFSASLRERAAAVIALYEERGLTLVTAESCTGGLIAGLMTETPGSSKVFERGFITYSDRSKEESLGVAPDLIDQFGAVSAEVASAMAEGALEHSAATVAISVTGIAGPGGGTATKPIGLVYFGYGRAGQIAILKKKFGDIGRSEVRLASIETALDLLFNASSF
ncbi:MAG: CinA family protein [Methylovirgula sp.]|uniref:CinA family protein n=1 Tax=Methylovirgula sp. TaxID=1978224 RepID=UPI0030760476